MPEKAGHGVFCSKSYGQLFWAQGRYVRAEYPRTGRHHLSEEVAIKGALIAGVYGLWDLTLEILSKTGNSGLIEKVGEALGIPHATELPAVRVINLLDAHPTD